MGVSGFVVVDASVAVKWLVREEHTDKALAIPEAVQHAIHPHEVGDFESVHGLVHMRPQCYNRMCRATPFPLMRSAVAQW